MPILRSIALFRGYLKKIRHYQKAEFTYKALIQRAHDSLGDAAVYPFQKVEENEFIESFNELLHGECLNEHWFSSIGDARKNHYLMV
ncbi:hypothetical protein SRABI13_00961 [Erwinia aphidicola]|uniref:transposase n=1 Tax=Erwinia aphidicola TaxID=68334 RepID=UPI001D487C8A|nr:transposase [Erwinia aphidicola]CAH0169026.1 hypothetical protein SRABI13_00961 [Erwinia aphidicola]